MSILNEKHFLNEKSAIKYVENIIWKNGKKCPHCQNTNQKRIYKVKSTKARLGTHKCADCKKQFTVKVGTVFEQSHIPLYKWLQACFLMSSSKKGISAHQLHRTLEITYKSAWFLAHRIREAMKELNLKQLGGNDKIVESDETFIGNEKEKPAGARGWNHKNKILSLVERKGKVKSFHISAVNVATIKPILKEALYQDTNLMTDEATWYQGMSKEFKTHEFVRHSAKEYVKDGYIHTNTIEGYFGLFKRGMKGIYQHCKSQHLKRYLCEFDFRYNRRDLNDINRAVEIVANAFGKRLKYKEVLVA